MSLAAVGPDAASPSPLPGPTALPSRASVGRAYLALTKPRIIELLLVTTIPPMVLARHALPPVWLAVWTLLGGSLAAGAANTINCVADRDIDRVMVRTRRRPLAADLPAVGTANALRFGLTLAVVATVVLGVGVNWLSAALADTAIGVYVFVYTLGLKRRTPANIVIGGAAGCFPALIGWSAATGRVGWPAAALFGVVFLWTPPHFWALAMRYRDDYAAAGVPMLPVVRPPVVVARRILGYSYAMVACSLLIAGVAGALYTVVAAVAGVAFLAEAHLLAQRCRRQEDPRAMRLFHGSITYLTVVFVAVAVSPLLR